MVGAVVGVLAAAPAARAELKVGVVDVVQVMNASERVADANDDLQAEQATLKVAAEKRFKAAEELALKRDGFIKGSAEWKKADEEAMKAAIDVQAWSTLEQAKVERKHRDFLQEVYREIATTVARLARDKALDLVFTKAFLSPPQINLDEAAGLEDLKSRILNQRVLYPATPTDITPEVIKTLNEAYRAAKKAAGGEARPATPAAPVVPPPRTGGATPKG
jgi:Skp family chaperone for outer membrane proteins